MKISIFGLGYVGAVTLGCLARDGHDIIGVDIDDTKLDLIQRGASPVIEEGLSELMKAAVESGRIEVTRDTVYAVHKTVLSFVCVGTPSRRNGGQDLSAMERIAGDLGEAARTKSDYHVFVIRSTVLPGTVEETIKPIIEDRSGKRVGRDFELCYLPEFLREGSSIKDFDNPPFTVVGGGSDRAIELLKEVFGHLRSDFITTAIRTAEMVKYCSNAFHALKITFANEIGRIAQSVSVDSHQVMDLVCRDTRLNISASYLKPGFAFGGSCLPKDVRALLRLAQENDVAVPMLSGILPSNRNQIDHAIEFVLGSGKRSVGMIGLSFKSGTDDLRESPLVLMAEQLIGKGFELSIYDPEVNLSRLIGANRRYIEETIPHISSLMREDCGEVVSQSDVVVVALKDEHSMRKLYSNARKDQLIVDLVGIPRTFDLAGQYKGVCW